MFNQYQFQPNMMQQPYQPMRQYSTLPRQEVVRVNGEGGANAYQLSPNSSALLLDESAPLVWLVTTDGAGFKTVAPYKIEPYRPQRTNSAIDLEARVKRLEELINEKSNDATVGKTSPAEYVTTVQSIQADDAGQRPASSCYQPSQQRKDESTTV